MRQLREKRMSVVKVQQESGDNMITSSHAEDKTKVPKITYLIREVILFDFKGKLMLLCSFETTNNVIVFEAHNGHFVHEFKFKNSILPLLRHDIIEMIKQKDSQNIENKRLHHNGGRSQSTAMTATDTGNLGSTTKSLRFQQS